MRYYLRAAHMRAFIRLLLVFVIITGCKKSIKNNSPAIARATVHNDAIAAVVTKEYLVSPTTTDPAITTFTQKHFVSVQEGGILKNTLFVFLPGSYRTPAESKGILQKAASMGYHVIGLQYPNTNPVNPLCKNTNDITCHRRARLEVIDGIDRHPSINVNPTNSILNRLLKLILYLQKTYPTENWGQFLKNGSIDWTKIIISGHSQGGALAGVIGKYYPIKKVVMFSIIDFLTSGKIPDWEDNPTNSSKYFAIYNINDEQVPYWYLKLGWQHLGMTIYGARVSVDWNAPPYSSTHTLMTSITPATTLVDKYHNSTAIDAYIPKNAAGVYIYDKAWAYLIGQ